MLPELMEVQTKDAIIQNFKGLNQKSFSSDEEFIDMENMTSDEYPYLAPRDSYAERRYTSTDYITCGAVSFDKDLYTVQAHMTQGAIDRVYLYKNMELVLVEGEGSQQVPVVLDTNSKERQMVKFGAYIFIYPDNILYNTEENTVENASYELDLSSASNRMYLSDKEGAPFILDNVTDLGGAVASGGFNMLISHSTGDNNNPKTTDAAITNAIAGSIYKTNYCQWSGTRTQLYDDNSTQPLYKANICMGQKDKATGNHQAATSYPLFWIEYSGDNYYIKRYQEQNNAWYPADLYVSWRLTTSQYAAIKDKIKIGDYIKLKALKSDNSEYTEEDFNKREATWNLVNTLSSGIKVENIITHNDTQTPANSGIILVFSNASLNFLKVLQENKQRFQWGKDQDKNREVIAMWNGVYYPYGANDNSLCYKAKLEKTVPEMDYITVSANRIWGCSSDNHEIYSCKQGDATSWYCYAGMASDSYAVTIASEGDFTGSITYNDMPYFFKENIAYGIYGNKPSNYQVQQFKCRGVEKGAYKTLCQKDGYVYYKSTTAVERFNGNNSQSLTDNLELKGLSGIAAEVCEDKLFISLTGNEYSAYIYDIKKSMWHKENGYINYPVILNGNLYNVGGSQGDIVATKIYGHSKEVATWLTTGTYDVPEWYVVSGEFNAQSVLNKYVERFLFELKLDEGSDLSISFSYNDSDEWEKVYRTRNNTNKKLIKVPITPKRLERMRYKIEGKGKCKIYSILMSIEQGSEIDG